MLQISIINESTAIADANVQKFIPAFAQQWNGDLRAVWAVDQATFSFAPKGTQPAAGSWWLVFLDDTDQANSLAYHDLTTDGWPLSKIFVKTILAENACVSVAATHEMCEMAVDPWLNSAYQDAQGVFWAGEICDPVEADQYGYLVDGVLVTDFVTPNWFGHQYAQSQIDLKQHAAAPFEILTGGYAQKFDPQSGWQQITGPMAMRSMMAARAIPGSRRERRARQYRTPLIRSLPHKWG